MSEISESSESSEKEEIENISIRLYYSLGEFCGFCVRISKLEKMDFEVVQRILKQNPITFAKLKK